MVALENAFFDLTDPLVLPRVVLMLTRGWTLRETKTIPNLAGQAPLRCVLLPHLRVNRYLLN